MKPKTDKKRRYQAYDDELLEFAETVQTHSSKAYDYLRTLFELPHQTTLNKIKKKGLQNVPDIGPDSISEAEDLVEPQSQESDPNHQDVSFTIDGMGTKESIEFCSDLKKPFGTIDLNQLEFLAEEEDIDRITNSNETFVMMFPCEHCRVTFEDYGDLEKHQKEGCENIHAEKNHVCEYCDKAFGRYESMILHKQTVHFAKRERSFKCDTCGKTFIKESNLEIHKRTHLQNKSDVQKAFQCTHCGNKFSKKYRMQVHIQNRHPDAKNFQCQSPRKGSPKTSKSKILRKSSRAPRGSKDYCGSQAENGGDWTCNGCQQVFSGKGTYVLYSHMLNFHIIFANLIVFTVFRQPCPTL